MQVYTGPISRLIEEFSKLPGVGKKTAQRLAFHVINMNTNDVEFLAGKVNGINIKLMKTGSIIEALSMINLAKAYNLKIMLGCMIESSCAISAAVHLTPLADYVDLDGNLLIENDPFCGLTLKNNKIVPSFEPGLGTSLCEI